MTNNFKQLYIQALDSLELGHTGDAEKLVADLRVQHEAAPQLELELVRRLMSTRLHYKQIQSLKDSDVFLNENLTQDPFLKAEVFFVKGLNSFHQDDFLGGAIFFREAAKLYPYEPFAAKSLLASYNEYIGLLNGGSLDEVEEEKHLSLLERMAQRIESSKLLGLILRQKSYLLERRGHLPSALVAADEGLLCLKKSGPLSDYQLLILQKCDLLFRLSKTEEARNLFFGLLGPFENRAQFAHAYVKSLIEGTPSPAVGAFAVVPTVWKNKSQLHQESQENTNSLLWNSAEGILISLQGEEITLKRDSIEGRILTMLANGKKDKDALCAALWPEEADSELINDRLKKSLRRLREKIPNLIQFDRSQYVLTVPLKIN